jgi:hypothetical protein
MIQTPGIKQKQIDFAITVTADNNPAAVSQKLFEMGVLPEQVELTSDQVTEVLYELLDAGRPDLLREAMRVPYNAQAGNYTVKLMPQILNRIKR